MNLPIYKTITGTLDEIEQEIYTLQKNLLELKIQKLTKQNIKTHLFIHIRRRLSQLEFKKHQIKNIKT